MTARPIPLSLRKRSESKAAGRAEAARASAAAVAGSVTPTSTDEEAAKARDRKVNARLAELDAYRALMMLVVLFHAFQASSGEYDIHVMRELSVGGVLLGNIDVLLPTFFVLSGFALYYQFAALVLSGRPLPGKRQWLFKRGLRLLPVYFVVFLLVWVWRYGGSTAQWEDLAYGMTLMQTWSTDHIFRTIDPGWYLSIEWQFAVIFAVAIMPWLSTIQKWPQRSRLAGLLVPPIILSLITIWWRTSLKNEAVEIDRWGSWFAPPSWGMMYAAGMVLGLIMVLRPPHKWTLPQPASLSIFLGSTAFLVWLQIKRGTAEFETLWYFHLGIIGSLGWLLAAITASPNSRTRRFMRSKAVQALAGASFVTYIVHAPILRSMAARDILPMDDPNIWWFSAISIVIVSLVVGLLLHRYVEGPLTSIEKMLEPKFARVAAVRKLTEPSITPGTRLPEISLADHLGRPHELATLSAGRPMLLLAYPTGLVPRHPSMQGMGGALRTLDGVRAAAAGMAIKLATLSPEPPRNVSDDDDGSQLPPIVRLVDPGSRVASMLGLAVARLADRRSVPELAMLVIDGSGFVTDVIREKDPHLMLHRALAAIDAQPASTGRRFQRRAVSRPAVPSSPLTPRPDAA